MSYSSMSRPLRTASSVVTVWTSVWYGATVRGDTGTVVIGQDTSIQEASTVHTENELVTRIGDRVTMGHHALVHAAEVGDDCIIGVNASVLTGAKVGNGSIVAAHAMVPIERVYGTVFENILGEKISTKPVDVVRPFSWIDKDGNRLTK